MGRVLIVVSTQYGQTAKIAEVIKARLEAHGQLVRIADVETNPNVLKNLDPETDTVILGAPVYIGKFPTSIMENARRDAARLERIKTGFFSVSLNAADKRPEARTADDTLLSDAATALGFLPKYVASFAGKIHYTRYGWFKRLMMKRICKAAGGPTDTSKDHEMTDWNQVADFADAIREGLSDTPFLLQHRLPQLKAGGSPIPVPH